MSEGGIPFSDCVLHSKQHLIGLVRMESPLRGMNLPKTRFRSAPLSKSLEKVRGFHNLQTYFPTLSKLFRITKHQSNQVWLDSKYRITTLDISGTSGTCHVGLSHNVDSSGESEISHETTAFLKVTHLLDPIRWMKGEYSLPKHTGLPWHSKTWAAAWTKLQDPYKQAYTEVVASYALSKLRDAGVSPHFNEFYGAFCARAEVYRYNLTEEFKSFRNSRWFWHGQKRGLYRLHVTHSKDTGEPVSEETLKEILHEPSEYSNDSSSEEEIEVDVVDDDVDVDIDVMSLHSDKMSDISFTKEDVDENEESGITEETDETEIEDEYRIYSEIHNFPIMMIGIEKNNGTMDSLLDDYTEVGSSPGSEEWELKWSAWIFQVIAALSVAQAVIGFTHNDLHTNNIVWINTTDEFLYYTKLSGEVFKVPTYGKLFRIIDFGRSIYSINQQRFFSDDFKSGNDADGQYCFKPLYSKPNHEVLPNPSFDLARLSVSLFDAIFPDPPEDKEGGTVLSSEEGVEMMETVSPLYNTLWSWMIDDNGCNILVDPSGEERFPDFDLYKHIAASVHGAVPSLQFSAPPFDRFQVNPSEIDDVKKWPLFA